MGTDLFLFLINLSPFLFTALGETGLHDHNGVSYTARGHNPHRPLGMVSDFFPQRSQRKKAVTTAFVEQGKSNRSLPPLALPVIPAKAGIHARGLLDSRLRGNDDQMGGAERLQGKVSVVAMCGIAGVLGWTVAIFTVGLEWG